MVDSTSQEVLAIETIHKFKTSLKKRAGGIRNLARSFQLLDKDKSGKLDKPEFETCLNRCGIFGSKSEISSIYKYFDKDGDGISLEEFLCALKEPLNSRRQNIVDRAFRVMDRDGSGEVTSDDVKHLYNAKDNPLVIQGKKTEAQVLVDFLNNFDGTEGNNDGKITKTEWDGY